MTQRAGGEKRARAPYTDASHRAAFVPRACAGNFWPFNFQIMCLGQFSFSKIASEKNLDGVIALMII